MLDTKQVSVTTLSENKLSGKVLFKKTWGGHTLADLYYKLKEALSIAGNFKIMTSPEGGEG